MKNYLCLCVSLMIYISVTPIATLIRDVVFNNGSTYSDVCILPPYPNEGTYKVANRPNSRPGEALTSFVLTVSCRRGFGLMNTDRNKDGTQIVYCVNGEWYQEMPQCVRFCKLDEHASVRYTCHEPGRGLSACSEYVAPGTLVKPVCNSPIYYSTEFLPHMKCQYGFWDYIAKCKPECGQVTPEGKRLVINGTTAKRGELPWHVGIYLKTTRPYMQVCGGTLINNNVAISAAHCFWHDVRKQRPAQEYAVAVGKIYRAWDHANDLGVQKSDVKEIQVPKLFRGQETNFQEDVAVLILASPFRYTTYIRPVCLNFDEKFDLIQLRRDKLGKVAGWGLTAANGKASPILQVLNMPFIDYDSCYNSFPQNFREYFTSDKFCAGYTSGSTVCQGDSGGGLAFPDKELGVYRHYLRGIVSTAPSHNSKLCNDNEYTTFTRIFKHRDFIKDAVADNVEKTCPIYWFQCADGTCVKPLADCDGERDCPDGSDEADELCIPGAGIADKPVCVLPPYPNHGTYTVVNVPEALPGQTLESFVLMVVCAPGYGGKGFKAGNGPEVYCDKGVWQQEMPSCDRSCKLRPDSSVSYMCNVPGSTETKPCPKYVAEGTSVWPKCNAPFYFSAMVLPKMKCIQGSWDYVARCSAECGRVPPSDPLTLDQRGELPWHVGIYQKTKIPYVQICGGSIVTNNVVISAASCFTSMTEKLLFSASMFAVAAGKVYRPWSDSRDINTQTSDVKEIRVPPRYRGPETNYQEDIAVLILASPFHYTIHIRPVCVDFDNAFERFQLREGSLGKAAGWGLTSANEPELSSLEIINMPFSIEVTCVTSYPLHIRKYFTSDKMCAGYTNGTSLCDSNVGGGLAFPDKSGSGNSRYYLRGVASTVPHLCNDSTYTIFTKITKHETFIVENISSSTTSTCPPNSVQCADGSCATEGDCKEEPEMPDDTNDKEELDTPEADTEQPGCVLPPYPNHGTYTVANVPEALPGQTLESFVLMVVCEPGYGDNDFKAGNGTEVYCDKGVLQQDMPSCDRYCELEEDSNVSYMCDVPGSTEQVPCSKYVTDGTSAEAVCHTPNYYSSNGLHKMKCIEGNWNFIARCISECGRVPPSDPLTLDQRGELPWHVGIYQKTKIPYMQICGGSIVSNNVVISATRCFYSDANEDLFPASNFAVAAGKSYRSWEDMRDLEVQKSDVKELKIMPERSTNSFNYHVEISILILATPFVYNSYVSPICLNFDEDFDTRQLQYGNTGKIAGWVSNPSNGTASPAFNVVQMSYISIGQCLSSFPSDMVPYVTSDKFCAGSAVNSTTLCFGDTGDGLAFPHTTEGIERYYLRGISSFGPYSSDAAYITFTRIIRYEHFIKQILI